MYNSIAYIIYLLCCLIIVVLVGKHLHRNGKPYLQENCPDKHLVDNANNLLYVCYCLVNTGFAFYQLNSLDTLSNLKEIIEFIASSIGFIILILGCMHFLNMLFIPKIIRLFSNTVPSITNPSDQQSGTKNKSL